MNLKYIKPDKIFMSLGEKVEKGKVGFMVYVNPERYDWDETQLRSIISYLELMAHSFKGQLLDKFAQENSFDNYRNKVEENAPPEKAITTG